MAEEQKVAIIMSNMAQIGKFVISVDHEFAWGYADRDLSLMDEKRIREEVVIVRRLLLLFEKYNIGVTWAIVGHLIDRGCPWGEDGTPHPEYPRPVHKNEKKDWFRNHPTKHEYRDTLWYDAENLASMIRASKAEHDIASHSYAHVLYDEENTNEESIKADLKNLGRVHRVHDVPLTSFIFPRNVEGYHRHLKVNGFTNYRGNSAKWYDNYSGVVKRAAHLIDYYLPVGRVVDPCHTVHGLVDVPDSMLLLGRNGARKYVTKKAMVRKAERGLDLAAKKGKVFHLWFHPSNFSYDTNTQFEILEDILIKANRMKEDGSLVIQTMEQVAEGCARK